MASTLEETALEIEELAEESFSDTALETELIIAVLLIKSDELDGLMLDDNEAALEELIVLALELATEELIILTLELAAEELTILALELTELVVIALFILEL